MLQCPMLQVILYLNWILCGEIMHGYPRCSSSRRTHELHVEVRVDAAQFVHHQVARHVRELDGRARHRERSVQRIRARETIALQVTQRRVAPEVVVERTSRSGPPVAGSLLLRESLSVEHQSKCCMCTSNWNGARVTYRRAAERGRGAT